jgi:hypothetical protein
MANDIEFMYASVKALVCIVKSNKETAREMDRLNSYQVIYDKNYENLCLKI